jgi:AcrR family transcriptional regulator
MSDPDKNETKLKIIKEASQMFSKFGFNGTSVRDIAQASGVNIASINYHFGSKHNLYWSIVQESKEWGERGFREISERVDTIEDMVDQAFDFLMSDKDAIRTTFKMMLTEGVPEPEGDLKEAMDVNVGPPGQEHIIALLQRQLGPGVPREKLVFAVESIFGSLIHWAFISCCPRVESMMKNNPQLKPKAIKQSLRMNAQAICNFIRG